MNKTPLELMQGIIDNTNKLLELRKIGAALMEAATISDPEVVRTIVRALAYRVEDLGGTSTDIWWRATELREWHTENLKAQLDAELGEDDAEV